MSGHVVGFRRAALAGLVLSGAALVASAAPADARVRAAAVEKTTSSPVHVPLAVSVAGAGSTWVTVAMGQTGVLQNTFWQLLVRSGGGSWKLVTPPGVADNGGLVETATGPGLLSAFLPSQDLRFTPLARTAAPSGSWSGALLPSLLDPVPDALAATASDAAFALVDSPQAIEASNPALSTWRRVASLSSLRSLPAAADCGLSALTALATDASGRLVVGGSCTRPGTVGLLVSVGGGWQRLAVSLPVPLRGDRFQVLRLRQGTGGLSALVVATDGTRRWLVALQAAATGAAVHVTASEPLASDQRLLSSGSLPAGGLYALVSGSGSAPPSVFAAPGDVASLPPGTSPLVFDSSASTEAFAAAGQTLTIWRRTGSAPWRVEQVIKVPLDYASSS